MQLEYRLLSEPEVSDLLNERSGWSVADGKLTRVFEFKTYKDGVVFCSAVGYIADKLNHHPDIQLTYGKVEISVNTHDVGGLSPYDFELARRIDAL